MSHIRPVCDLENYMEVLKEVRKNQPVYLTIDGHIEYAILKIEDFYRLRASVALLAQLEEGEKSAREGGWMSADKLLDL